MSEIQIIESDLSRLLRAVNLKPYVEQGREFICRDDEGNYYSLDVAECLKVPVTIIDRREVLIRLRNLLN